MTDLKIGVIVGSTRPGRKARTVAEWVIEQTEGREGVQYDLIDLADFDLPHLDELLPPVLHQYQNEHTHVWAAKIAEYDGFVFVTPEYNHSISGVLKTAIDYLQAEWHNKAAALVGYGSFGGVRAMEHLRGILSECQLAHVRQTVSFSLFTDFENLSVFTPADLHKQELDVMFDQLEAWARALQPVREELLVA